MALLEIAVASGVCGLGVRVYRNLNQKKHLATVLLAPAADSKLSRSTNALEKQGMGQSLLSNIDSHYQTFVRTRLDPLLSGQAHQHQMALRSGNDDAPPPGELEKHINRRFGLAVLTLANTVLATIFFPPLIIFSLASALYPVGYYFVDAYRDLTQERRVSLNLIGALYVSGMWLARYFLFGSFALVLFAVGSKVRFLMEGRSREGIQTIFGQQSRYAWLVVDGVEIETPVEELQVGDIVVVNAGEAIPVDGVMVKGIALVDQHALTGESQPIEKILGDSVFASTLMLTGRASIQVKKAGSETTAAQINEILIQTAEHRTEIESRGLELANKGALPTLLTGLVAYPLFGLTGAVAALGAGFGYNLRTVSILSMMNYVQVAARKAVLIKDGRALERLDEVDTIVFDKTGTLTLEQPHVAQIHCLQEHLTENDVLTYAAAAEYRQPHPIAKAIIATSEERNLTLPEIDEASYEVGYGIQVTVGKQLIRVGSERFMKMEGIVIPESIRTLQAACQHQGHSLVMVALDAQLIGALELHATLRPEVETVLTDLRHRNLNLAIISGDQEEPTRALAQSLGIDSYYANVLPEDKALLIKQLQDEGRIVCFIGDGINDAIALKQADVSVSLLGATTIATDTAQIVLMDQSLTRLGELLDLATNFDTTIRHGFWTTMVPGFVCIGGVFFLHFGIIASELLFQLGFFTGLGVAMKPLLDEQRENTSFV